MPPFFGKPYGILLLPVREPSYVLLRGLPTVFNWREIWWSGAVKEAVKVISCLPVLHIPCGGCICLRNTIATVPIFLKHEGRVVLDLGLHYRVEDMIYVVRSSHFAISIGRNVVEDQFRLKIMAHCTLSVSLLLLHYLLISVLLFLDTIDIVSLA